MNKRTKLIIGGVALAGVAVFLLSKRAKAGSFQPSNPQISSTPPTNNQSSFPVPQGNTCPAGFRLVSEWGVDVCVPDSIPSDTTVIDL